MPVEALERAEDTTKVSKRRATRKPRAGAPSNEYNERPSLRALVPQELTRINSDRFSSSDIEHIRIIARRIRKGQIVAYPFNGVFGLFGDIDYPPVVEMIHEAKRRPPDKKLVGIYPPKNLHEICDFTKMRYTRAQIAALQTDLHALGIILPASTRAPYHLVDRERETILSIWTNYDPLKQLVAEVRKLGGRGLVGTSANIHGEKTHWRYDELVTDFDGAVDMLAEADFSNLPELRRRSTSIVDLTGDSPRLHREGNVPEEEIRQALFRHKFGELTVGQAVIVVRPRQ